MNPETILNEIHPIKEALKEPPTVDELLADGQKILAEKRERESSREAEQEAAVMREWSELRDLALRTFGEVAVNLPPTPPSGFSPNALNFELELQPFGDAWLTVEARRRHGDGRWVMPEGGLPFGVPTLYVPLSDDAGCDLEETLGWPPVPSLSRRVATLAEAVALCWEAGPSYRDALMRQQKRFRDAARGRREVVISGPVSSPAAQAGPPPRDVDPGPPPEGA